jgi:general secretion pathway protein F/type IV pilus assembly protein PilC
MPDFTYVARDGAGQQLTGTISAASRGEAANTLAARAIFPIKVEEASETVDSNRVKRVPAAMMAVAFGQMADLLRSGVPLLRAIEVVENQTSHMGLKSIIADIHRRVQDGASLADAMARYQSVLGDMAVSMVRAGSEGGFLEEALTRVAQFVETQDDLKKRTMGALAYPAVLACLGTVIVIGLVVFLVPNFNDLFQSLRERGQLPGVTEALLATSDFLRSRWGILLFLALIGGGYSLNRWLATEPGMWWADRVRLRLPLVGPVFLGLAVARFCRVLGTLLRNGVPILRSMQISRDSTGNRVLGAAIASATENISAGQSLAGPLRESGQFPAIVVEMIAVAEQANNLENVLLSIADSMEKNTWRRLDIAVRLVEPLMLVILAVVIGTMVIALLLPVLRMGSTV